MNIIETIILGIIQGIGEFLPISSSAHLIIIPYLFNFADIGSANSKLAFDVALHAGTLISVLIIYYKDWINLFKGACNKIFKKKDSFENKMFWYLVLATIPGAIIGFLLEDIIESAVRGNLLIIAICLAIMGVLLYLGDKWAKKKYTNNQTNFENLTLKQTFIIGLSQALAVIPGFSRSGTTILTGRLLGVSKTAITKFTFLLSTPIIFGAALVNIKDLVITKEVIIGILTSAIVGIITIKFLLNYIKKHDFSVFAVYRVVLAIIIIIKLIIVK